MHRDDKKLKRKILGGPERLFFHLAMECYHWRYPYYYTSPHEDWRYHSSNTKIVCEINHRMLRLPMAETKKFITHINPHT